MIRTLIIPVGELDGLKEEASGPNWAPWGNIVKIAQRLI